MEKHEKNLIIVTLLMASYIIIYNLFFIPEVKILNPGDYIKYKLDMQISDDEKEVPQKKSNYIININTADEKELFENLNGVGEVIAGRIIEYRESNGGFLNIEEIKNVKGIGEKNFEKIKNNIKI